MSEPKTMSDVEALFANAAAALDAHRIAEAEDLYRLAVRLAPGAAIAHHNLGAFLRAVGRLAEAETALRAALRLDPGSAASRHGLGTVLLSQGRYGEGWPYYDARHAVPQLGLPKPALPYPEWRGEDLAGRSLLVFGEQGFGDQIMFARFARELVRGGADVTLLCPPALVRLFQDLGPRVVPMSGEAHFPDPDYWVMSGSIAGRSGAMPETLPAAPYLSGAAGRKGGVGVVTKGNPRHTNDANRSLPSAEAQRLLAMPGAVSLHPEDTGARAFQDTADLIAGLDLVITADTAVAHLAGAMGTPVWIMIPALMTDWRWMQARSDSPWYPSARLYRQPAWGDWAAVVDRVLADRARLS
jgi:hypothetical protein